MGKNKFSHIQTENNSRINIPLTNFSFFHSPNSIEDENQFYMPDSTPEHQLTNWLSKNEAKGGSYLITGYRGAGKTSFVNHTIKQLTKTDKEKKYIPISISLGQENMQEIEILRILAKSILEELENEHCENDEEYRENYWNFIMRCSIVLLIISIVLIVVNTCYHDFFVKFYEELTSPMLFWNIIKYFLILPIIIYAISEINKKRRIYSFKDKIYKRVSSLCTRLNSTVTDKTQSNIGIKVKDFISSLGFSKQSSTQTPPASIQEIEFELKNILDELSSRSPKKHIIVIFDELDKVDTNRRTDVKSSTELPEYEKLSVRPERHVSSRERTEQVLSIIAGMKYFLSTAKAYFIFIAGRELYEAFQADMCDRDFSISSIFNGVLNISSFLNGKHKRNNATLKTEEYVCRHIMPRGFDEAFKKDQNKYDSEHKYSLKNYYSFCKDFENHNKNLHENTLFLYRFVTYLTFISNGSPKKLTIFFEKYVRSIEYIQTRDKEQKDLYIDKFYLSFNRQSIQKINFIHYLVYPIMQYMLNRNKYLGDKLLVSSSFLVTYILKMHNSGFSWRNLEQVPELQEINKTPELREYMGRIIGFMNRSIITTIPSGLYHYKFPIRLTEEIFYYSEISTEISTLFNFSAIDFQSMKNHYLDLIQRNTDINDQNSSPYALASIHHSLGDVFMLEENYSSAIRAYERCVEIVLPMLDTTGSQYSPQAENYLLFLNRTMLKLGLAHEKRRTDNSAFVVYDELIEILKKYVSRPEFKAIFADTRTMHLAILAKLYVLEKIDTDGICRRHLDTAIDDFNKIHSVRSNTYGWDSFRMKMYKAESQVDLVRADFYRRMANILYYKNKTSESGDNPYNAEAYYIRSIQEIFHTDTEDICNYLPNKEKLDSKLRDNQNYLLALAVQGMGNVSINGKENSSVSGFIQFCTNFQDIIEQKEIKEKKEIQGNNNFEKAILYYWNAIKLYKNSCESGLSTKCYSQILYLLLLYIRSVKEIFSSENSTVDSKDDKFIEIVIKSLEVILTEDLTKAVKAKLIEALTANAKIVQADTEAVQVRFAENLNSITKEVNLTKAKTEAIQAQFADVLKTVIKEVGLTKALTGFVQADTEVVQTQLADILKTAIEEVDLTKALKEDVQADTKVVQTQLADVLKTAIEEVDLTKALTEDVQINPKVVKAAIEKVNLIGVLIEHLQGVVIAKLTEKFTDIVEKIVKAKFKEIVTNIVVGTVKVKLTKTVTNVIEETVKTVEEKDYIKDVLRNIRENFKISFEKEFNNYVQDSFNKSIADIDKSLPAAVLETVIQEGKFVTLVHSIIHEFLLSLHNQKRHIHLMEMNNIKWMESLEMYEKLDIDSLSLMPDVEEVIYIYRTIMLELWTNGMTSLSNSLIQFYKSPLMTGKNIYQTMRSKILMLKLKAKFNLILLDKIFQLDGDIFNLTLEKINNYVKNGDSLNDLKDFFMKDKTTVLQEPEDRMDLLETLIGDTIFCLSEISEMILPLNNSVLFTNLFKAKLYYDQLRITMFYQHLYCYYALSDVNDIDVCERVKQFLHLDSTTHFKVNVNRKIPFYESIKEYTHNNTDSTDICYLGEKCIYHYKRAKQLHNQGRAYQDMIRNLFFLDDDLNSDELPFYMAIERLQLNKEEGWNSKITNLIEKLKAMEPYKLEDIFDWKESDNN